MRVSEIRVNQIRVNQGLGVIVTTSRCVKIKSKMNYDFIKDRT